MRRSLPQLLVFVVLALSSGCGPSGDELREQERYNAEQQEKNDKFNADFAAVVQARERLAKIVAAWPDAASPPAAGTCQGAADTVIFEREAVARFGKAPFTTVEGEVLTDRTIMPAALGRGLDLQRRRNEAEARRASEKIAELAEDDWGRFRGDALREFEPIIAELQQVVAAPRTAVFGAVSLVQPKVTGDDSFTPGRYTGVLVIFDSATGAALCSAPLDVTNRATVTEARMSGGALTNAPLADLIGVAYQATVAQIEVLAPGSKVVPAPI